MSNQSDGWIKIHKDTLPQEGVVVQTKIDDGVESRNETTLKLQGSMWFMPDGKMYVYYVPTHWRPDA